MKHEQRFWQRWRRKPKFTNKTTFTQITPSSRILEYKGSFAITPYAIHYFFCEKITEKNKDVEGNILQVGKGEIPTHIFMCVSYLANKPHQKRLCFSFYVCLSEILTTRGFLSEILQDSIAKIIAIDLVKSLKTVKYNCFLMRCESDNEYPWCVSPERFDEYWIMQIESFYRVEMKRLKNIGIIIG